MIQSYPETRAVCTEYLETQMLDSLFPFGFILIAVFGFLLFMFGALTGMTAGVMIGNNKHQAIIPTIAAVTIGGIVLAFMEYHMVWGMLCRQFTC